MKKLSDLCQQPAMTSNISASALPEVPAINLCDNLNIPLLGCGVWELSPQEAYKSVSQSIKLGYRLIDTAQYYNNEKMTYKAVEDSGVARDEIFITSKLDPGNGASEETIRSSLDRSLGNMGGKIDLMLIHWPFGNDELAWVIMEEYVREGRFKAIGLSNYSPENVRRIISVASIAPVLNQIEVHPYNSRYKTVEENRKLGLAVEAWSPLGAGRQGLMKDPVLLTLANKYSKSVAQIILRWDIQRGIITIPRSADPAHIRDNISIFDFELSDEDMKKINAINRDDALWDI